jgi:hypothetical protein
LLVAREREPRDHARDDLVEVRAGQGGGQGSGLRARGGARREELTEAELELERREVGEVPGERIELGRIHPRAFVVVATIAQPPCFVAVASAATRQTGVVARGPDLGRRERPLPPPRRRSRGFAAEPPADSSLLLRGGSARLAALGARSGRGDRALQTIGEATGGAERVGSSRPRATRIALVRSGRDAAGGQRSAGSIVDGGHGGLSARPGVSFVSDISTHPMSWGRVFRNEIR